MSEHRDIELAPAAEDTAGASGRNVVAVIGIDHYTGWRRLTNAVADARGAAALFGMLGFEQVTEPLLDHRATGKAIQELVTDDLMTLEPDDNLVLFYAGHGGTREHRLGDQVVKTGYLIPVDASQRAATWVELDAWLRAISLLPPKHILVILDACYSGIALGPVIKWRDTGTWQNTPLSTLKARRSRRIIASALDNQLALDGGPVHGHSLFTGCLIEGLTHGIGQSGSRVTTGSELGLYLQRRVEAYPNSRQTPDFGTFDFDDRGEMVIPLMAEGPVSEISAAQGVEAAPSGGATPAAVERTRPQRSRSHLPLTARAAAVLGMIIAATIWLSRGGDDAADPDPATRVAASPPAPPAPQDHEPARSLAPLDVTPATAPPLVSDAAAAAVPPGAPPAVITPPRPPASVSKESPKAPAKLKPHSKQKAEQESKQKPPAPTVPARDGMLQPKGIQ